MRKITQDLKVSGIYCIINLKNSKRYIGKNLKYKRKYMIYRTLPCN